MFASARSRRILTLPPNGNGAERGCVVLDQPQRVPPFTRRANHRAAHLFARLRLVFYPAALRGRVKLRRLAAPASAALPLWASRPPQPSSLIVARPTWFFSCLAVAAVSLLFPVTAAGVEDVHAGFAFDRHELVLEPGERTEAVGPFFYETKTEFENIFALPPVFSHSTIPATDSEEYDFVYPLLTYDRFGQEYRWQLGQLLSFSGGQNQAEAGIHRFTVFPFYFQQRSEVDPTQDYTAVFPFYGKMRNHVFRSRTEWLLWPLYLKTVKRGRASPLPNDPFVAIKYRYLSSRRGEVTTYNYFYPFFHIRSGDGLAGWQFWPVVGHEHQDVTTKTNEWGDLQTTPGADSRFVVWPFYHRQEREIGTTNQESDLLVFPFYNEFRSPQRDSTSYLTPFGLTITDDRARKYHEVGAPWPFIVFAHGEGKTTKRVWPFFSQAHSDSLESNFYLWPLYKFNGIHASSLDRGRTRIALFLYQYTRDQNLETGKYRSRTDLWPFFVHRHNLDGTSRLQVLAPLETFLPMSKSIERNYSPLWTVWRDEQNPTTGHRSQSLLWNLYRRESSPTTKKSSLLFGLFQYESGAETKRWRLFYLPLNKSQDHSDHVPERR